MTTSILNPNFQQTTLQNFISDFPEYMDEIFVEFEEDYADKFFSKEFKTEIAKLNQDKSVFQYSPLTFYFAKQMEDALFIAHLHFEAQDDEDAEIEIFDFWKDSDFGEIFLERNQRDGGENILETSLSFRPLLENQVLSFYYLHISSKPELQPDILDYYIQSNLGDSKDRIYLTDSHYSVNQKDLFDGGVLEVNCLTNMRTSLEAQSDNDIKAYVINKEPNSLTVDGRVLFINSPVELDDKIDAFKTNVERALANIKKASPELFECFFTFTHTLVPVADTGIVSFSSQFLPGYSSLNIVDRDYIELHDDLLHENGHHFLNAILNTTELIEEDDEQIFYSPWRKVRRPIRGIYHAYFTFFWAFQLFYDLTNAINENIELDGISKSDLSRCALRALEEFTMLNYSFEDLKAAKEMGKITDEGFEVISLVEENLNSAAGKVDSFKEFLSVDDKKKLSDLESELKNQLSLNSY
ncbi:MAG: hypothetical protein EP326_10565 [Deltaproteobacteria bacterium]|nr:MAG: hypothetical protein EP326_10565 [Deltaproteobacteria bacterium]